MKKTNKQWLADFRLKKTTLIGYINNLIKGIKNQCANGRCPETKDINGFGIEDMDPFDLENLLKHPFNFPFCNQCAKQYEFKLKSNREDFKQAVFDKSDFEGSNLNRKGQIGPNLVGANVEGLIMTSKQFITIIKSAILVKEKFVKDKEDD